MVLTLIMSIHIIINISSIVKIGDIVLLKASHGMELSKVVDKLIEL